MQRLPIYRIELVRERTAPIYSRRFSNPTDACEWAWTEFYEAADRELFHCIMLDSKNIMIGCNLVSTGNLNTSIVHPRECFKPAILANSAAIICLHNHPSGDPLPSREDNDCTKRILEGSRLLGIRMLDHIIVGGPSRYYSYAVAGTLA